MSIIYDALKKTQQNLNYLKKNESKKFVSFTHWIDYFLITIIFFLFGISIWAYYPKLKHTFMKHTISKAPLHANNKIIVKPVPKEIEYQGKLALNGVFLSEMDKIAIINKQTLHIGDKIDGMKIVKIDLNTVYLKKDETTYIMRATA